jgi:tetratricopeptide (TPR) repeat protein
LVYHFLPLSFNPLFAFLTKNINFSSNLDLSIQDNAKILLNSLQEISGNNLLILDNLGYDAIDIIDSLPNNSWKVLASSRIELEKFTTFQIGNLNDLDSYELFITHYPYNDISIQDINSLNNIIGYHTQTVEIISKILFEKRGRLTIDDVIRKLEQNQIETEELQILVDIESPAPNTRKKSIRIYSHLLSLFELSELDNNEIEILIKFSVFPPVDIELNFILMAISWDESDKDPYSVTIKKLAEKGWLISDKVNQTFRCHQMIQEVIRHKFVPTFEDHKVYIGFLSINLMQDLSLRIKLIPYLECAVKYFGDILPEIVPMLNLSIADTYRQIGNLSKSNKLINNEYKSVEISDPRIKINLLVKKGDNDKDLGNFTDSLECYFEALQEIDSDKSLGWGDLKVSLVSRIGDIYLMTNELNKAYDFYSQQLDYINALKSGFPTHEIEYKMSKYYYDLGRLYNKMDKSNDAIKYILNSASILENLLKKEVNEGLFNKFSGINADKIENNLGLRYSLLGEIYAANNDHIKSLSYLYKDSLICLKNYQNNPLSEGVIPI